MFTIKMHVACRRKMRNRWKKEKRTAVNIANGDNMSCPSCETCTQGRSRVQSEHIIRLSHTICDVVVKLAFCLISEQKG
jgi:hypothetical protein